MQKKGKTNGNVNLTCDHMDLFLAPYVSVHISVCYKEKSLFLISLLCAAQAHKRASKPLPCFWSTSSHENCSSPLDRMMLFNFTRLGDRWYEKEQLKVMEIVPLGTINPHQAWMNTAKATKPQPFRLECLHTWASHFGSGRLPPKIPWRDAGGFHKLWPLSDGGQLFFFSLFPVRETVSEAHQSINRQQVAAAHFLLVFPKVNCVSWGSTTGAFNQLPVFPQCPQYVLYSMNCWHCSNQIHQSCVILK